MRTPRHLFNLTATLLKPGMVKDSGGSVVKTFTESGTFRCRIQGPPGAEDEVSRLGHRSFYTAYLYCGPEVDIREIDRVKVGSDTWDVEGIDEVDGMGVYKQVSIKRSK